MISRRTQVILCAVSIGIGGISIPVILDVEIPQSTLLPVSFLFLTLMLWVWVRRMSVTVDRPARADPETSRDIPVPGATFDQRLRKAQSRTSDPDSYTHQRIHDQLESIAQRLLTTYGQMDANKAAEQIRRGTWTDNDVATTFLQEEILSPSLSAQIRGYWKSSSYYVYCADQTVTALLEYTGNLQDTQQQDQSLFHSVLGWNSSGPTTPSDRTNKTEDESGTEVKASQLTYHWQGISALALGGLAFGLIFASPGLLLASAIGVSYTAYSRYQPEPQLDVTVNHSFSNPSPYPGEELTITVTVHNDGDNVISDLRVIDGVPTDLAVVNGSPRHATVLPSGEITSFQYTVQVRRGTHPFTPVLVCARPVSDTVEVERTIDTDVEIVSRPIRASELHPSVRKQMAKYVGQNPTQTGGHGLEFHSVRQYRHGDPVNRIDWKRFARSGDLATIAYREERAAKILIAIDTREAAYIAPSPRERTACDRSVTGATKLATTLLKSGNQVGLTAFGPEECWVPPTGTQKSGQRIREVLTKHAAFSHVPPDEPCYATDWIEMFRHRISNVTQIILFSPLSDQAAVTVALTLEAYGHRVTVISPDPTSQETVGQRVAALKRDLRISTLRKAGVWVVDWPTSRRLEAAFEQLTHRRDT